MASALALRDGTCTRYVNCIKERELDLRGIKAPAIENLGATRDQFDTIDLSDNEIKKLDNFPLVLPFTYLSCAVLAVRRALFRVPAVLARWCNCVTLQLKRLGCLLLSNNRISKIADGLATNLPKLHTVVLRARCAQVEVLREWLCPL